MTSERGQDVRPNAGRRGGAFSLIEVMLGVLILALGLLGLAAVMPAVVAQQRSAANTTLGNGAIGSAKDYLSRRPDLNRLGTDADRRGLGNWFWDFNNWSNNYEWEAPVEILTDSGEFELGTNVNTKVVIPVGERLWPNVGSGRSAPIFVWDFLARRVPSESGSLALNVDSLKPEIELVVFVRRIDPGIRPSGGDSLWNALLAGPGDQPDSLAVGENEMTGVPTLNGEGIYSTPKRFDVVFDTGSSGQRNRLRLVSQTQNGFIANGNFASLGDDDALRNLASMPGQKLVDNLGNVYTVVGPHPTLEDEIIIDPPVPAWVNETADAGVGDIEFWDVLHQVVFTPQIPAAVEVFRLRAADPKE